MIRRPDMINALHVRGPSQLVRILGPGDHEAQIGTAPRGLDEELVERGLPVGAVGAQIGKIPPGLGLERPVDLRIRRAEQGPRRRGTVALLQQVQGRSAGEGEVDVVFGHLVARQIFAIVLLEACKRDRRVDVVEGDRPRGGAPRPATDVHAVRRIGPHDDGVRLAHRVREAFQILKVAIEGQAAEVRGGQVAMVGVPGRLAFQEENLMTARRKGRKERPIGHRVTIPPG